MPYMQDPTPDRPQVTGDEQRQIIRAALETLDPAIFEIRPGANDRATLADHFEEAILDAMRSSNNCEAVPKLFCDMAQAATGKLREIVEGRPGGVPLG